MITTNMKGWTKKMENIKDFFKSKLGRVTIRAIVEIVVATSLMLGIYYGLGKTKEADRKSVV